MLTRSIVAASTAPMAHATARSRMRPASTSRRWGSSSLLSLRPRTGRSSDRITALAKTAPNNAPRPTSSTPATAWKPRARSSRSSVASQRNLPPAGAGRMARPKLVALFQTGGLALKGAQIVQLGAAYAACADDIDMVHHLGVYREDTLHALAETDLADGDALAHARAIAGNQDAFEGLEALFLAFLDLDVNLDGVTGAKLGEFFLPLVLGNKLGQQRILHDNVRNLLVYNMFRVRGELERRKDARHKSGRRGDSSAKRLESERMCTQGSGGFCGALSKTPLLGSAGKGLQFDGIAKFAHLSRECRYAALHGLGIQPPRTSFDIADLVMQHFPDHLRDPMSNCPDRFVHS